MLTLPEGQIPITLPRDVQEVVWDAGMLWMTFLCFSFLETTSSFCIWPPCVSDHLPDTLGSAIRNVGQHLLKACRQGNVSAICLTMTLVPSGHLCHWSTYSPPLPPVWKNQFLVAVTWFIHKDEWKILFILSSYNAIILYYSIFHPSVGISISISCLLFHFNKSTKVAYNTIKENKNTCFLQGASDNPSTPPVLPVSLVGGMLKTIQWASWLISDLNWSPTFCATPQTGDSQIAQVASLYLHEETRCL